MAWHTRTPTTTLRCSSQLCISFDTNHPLTFLHISSHAAIENVCRSRKSSKKLRKNRKKKVSALTRWRHFAVSDKRKFSKWQTTLRNEVEKWGVQVAPHSLHILYGDGVRNKWKTNYSSGRGTLPLTEWVCNSSITATRSYHLYCTIPIKVNMLWCAMGRRQQQQLILRARLRVIIIIIIIIILQRKRHTTISCQFR